MNVSAAHVRASFLDPAMDARALNLEQHFWIDNGTPECDSVLDHLACIDPDSISERTHLEQLRALAFVVAAENMSEGQIERTICGAADLLARDLRGVELNGVSGVLAAKGIARLVRGPVDRMLAGDESFEDACALVDVFARVPSAQLLSHAVEHELWTKRFAKLRELHGRWVSARGGA